MQIYYAKRNMQNALAAHYVTMSIICVKRAFEDQNNDV